MPKTATRPAPFDYETHYATICNAIHAECLALARGQVWERITVGIHPQTGERFIALDTPAPAGFWSLPAGPYAITCGTPYPVWRRNIGEGMRTAPVFAGMAWEATS
jgi:hypothetical protein